MNPEDCPPAWEHNPSDVRLDTWSDIPVLNVWKHKESSEIIIQFKTTSILQNNHYVEEHSNPKQIKTRLNKIKEILTKSEDLDTKLDKITVTKGRLISGKQSADQTLKDALEYMEDR